MPNDTDPKTVNEELLKENPGQTRAPYQIKQGQEPIPNPNIEVGEPDKK